MVAPIPSVLVFSAVVANLAQGILGLMCYECNSLMHPGCENLRREDKFNVLYVHCTPFTTDENVTEYRKPLCRKITQKIRTRGNLRLTKRSCGHMLYKNLEEDICYDVRNEDHEEVVCQCFEDGCNSGWSISGNFSLLCITLCLLSIFVSNSR